MTEQLTLEAGKRYWRRNGSLTNTIYHQGGNLFAEDRSSGANFYGNGRKSLDNETPLDLVREYIETVTMNAPTAEPQDEWGPWIGWNGGECPVDGEPKMELAFDDGRVHRTSIRPSAWDWDDRTSGKIIAYRIKKEKPKPQLLYAEYVQKDIGPSGGFAQAVYIATKEYKVAEIQVWGMKAVDT